MPAQRQRASFEPIPPNFDVRQLVENTDNFQYVDRISVDMIQQQGIEQFEKLVLLHVVIGGKPLVVDGFEDLLDPWTFTPGWLMANQGDKVEDARNLTAKENLPLTMGHYLKNMGLLTDQYFEKPDNYKEKNRQRIYLKDIDCPQVWHDKLREHIPPSLFYLNESTGDIGGLGAVDEPIPNAAGRRKGKGIARAGDLMSSLPPDMRAQNLQCYIGHEGTYTPAHREMCASLGQNIMVNASATVGENGKPEKPGSSIWFMTEAKDRHMVSEYWLSVLGHDIEVENHFAQLAAWKHAPFKTFVVEQRPGDFILIPPLAPHQVWNRGTRTVKVAWNRTTVETLEMAFKEALPNARMVCRDEQYKNRAIVYYTLQKYSGLLRQAKVQSEASQEVAVQLKASIKVRQVQRDFKRLFELYKGILLSEMFAPDAPKEHPEFLPYESHVTCAYCRGNIFNRFLTCKSCTHALGTDAEEPYDVCMDCYAMGRSCACISGLKWVEQWRWKDLLYKYEEWRKLVVDLDDGRITEKTPLPLQEERRGLMKKTLAQVCQEQLKFRPWHDIKNPQAREEDDKSDEEIIVNDDGTVKKTVKKRSKAWLANHRSCHVCFHRHPKWKMAGCTTCDLWYCYGTLFRAHDMMPQTIMENPRWQCPHCLRVCSAGNCRRDPRQHPYEPKGTLLGHDTRKVADARSVEALVDFSVSNLNWLRDEDPTPGGSARLRRRREEAEREKLTNPMHDERFVDDDNLYDQDLDQTQIEYSPAPGAEDESFLNPSLRSNPSNGNTLPPPSAMLNGARPHNGSPLFIAQYDGASPHAPSRSAMYREDMMDVDDDNSLYPNIDGEDVQVFKSSHKRRHVGDPDDLIKLSQSKRQKTSKEKSAQAKSDATKQFLKQQEKQKLEQAKKDGRFIQVLAAMKGRKAVVTLRLPSDRLAEIRARDLEKRNRQRAAFGRDGINDDSAQNGEIAILRSDIANGKQAGPGADGAPKTKKPNQVRVRMEEDEDFGGPKRKPRTRFESISVGSSEDEDLDDMHDGEYPAPRERSQRRARANSGELVELPEDWRDSRASKRERNAGRRQTLATAGAQIRPSGGKKKGRPPRASTGQMRSAFGGVISSGEEEESGLEDESSPPQQQPAPMAPMYQATTAREDPAAVAAAAAEAQAKAKAKAQAAAEAKAAAAASRAARQKAEQERKARAEQAAREAAEAKRKAREAARVEEENRLAKLEAARWARGDDDFSSDSEERRRRADVSSSSPEVARQSLKAKPSILNRTGRGGKKIRIVGPAGRAALAKPGAGAGAASAASAASASTSTSKSAPAGALPMRSASSRKSGSSRKANEVQLSDTESESESESSDSGGEILARAAVVAPAAKTGAPALRGGGGGTAGAVRGRGGARARARARGRGR
ncbi:uncharacterized protein K452DRAFT_318054 [Aplosporella prunicola CBS 121167]|uniref:JmjC domain-containing protein n=1 Tax=Aplosporella prunicola CBS 121167 TaxID=1176127 RepID=A0A6A6BIL2_9PEZI|nr:uncharacterized protein K452DRAFT_318054 [Aplosporella prunicola CBS 121167]KAF2142411.1 hypothetical protein K452DRAFT_318054 [Aplosporella prunicola CBS 121167]